MASRPARGSVVPPSAIPESPVLHDPIYFAPGTASNGLQIRELFDLLLRGKWIILAALLAVAIPVTIYTMLQPSVYSAYSLLLVHKQDESLADVMPGGVSASFWRSERNLGNELLVLRQSEALADSAARVLMQFPRIPSTGETPTILQVPEGEELTPEYVGARLQGGYVVANMEGADVDAIRVTAVSTIPAEAAMIADIYANAFVKRTRESSRAATSASREFLEEQLQTQAQRLDELDGAVRDFMMSEGAVDLDEASRRLVNQVAELQGRRDEALIDIRMKQATIGQLETELG
ncbi:MAG: hypothetical protein HKN04_10485, partial [Rhodothermaceae bacterium]|nr:hypothetical protein [Rhodothermaceae bacterium]